MQRIVPWMVPILLMLGCGETPVPPAPESPPAARPAYYFVEVPDGAPTRGNENAPVTIVTFSDFQSPMGASNARALSELADQFGKDLRLVYRANPQPRNRDSRKAEIFARAADRQGKFWQVYNLLFQGGKLGDADLRAAATQAGCDELSLERDIENLEIAALVARDRQAALELGIRTAPYNFVNGRPMKAVRYPDDAAVVVREELKRARAIIAAGGGSDQPYKQIISGGEKQLPGKRSNQREQLDPRARYRVPVLEDDGSRGEPNARVTVVVFMDFEGPFARQTSRTLQHLERALENDVTIVVKNFPQPNHPAAALAAESLVEARSQGVYWKLHEIMAGNRDPVNRDSITKMCTEAGMDMDKVSAALDGRTHSARVEEDRSLAASLGLFGTPHFFVNGLRMSGSHSADQLLVVAGRELAADNESSEPDGGGGNHYELIVKNGATAPVHLEPGSNSYDPEIVLDGDYRVYNVTVPEDAPRLGPDDASVVVVEYGDYQCTYCKMVELSLRELQKRHGKQMSLVYKHFPLGGHEHARLAAEASVEAREQGDFWTFHSRLMENQDALTLDDLVRHASDVGLDPKRMRAALEDRRHKERISLDIREARKLHLTGTPAFFINGRRPPGGRLDKKIETLVDRLIAEKKN